MVVLSAIGRFFKKIWDWIKQTAWIQPLLIVGIIFGVIFSIPSIVNAIKDGNAKKNSAEVFYLQYQYSLEGDSNSKADKLTRAILNGDDYGISEDKFFLCFVAEECPKCADAKGGFQVLEENFGGTFKPNDGKPFKMITIFADQETSSTTDDKTAFVQYMERNDIFFADAAGRAANTAYHDAGKTSDEDIMYMEQIDPDNFLTPTIMLVEKTVDSSLVQRGYAAGVTEVMFGVEGSGDYGKAQTLLDCWNHAGDFNELD